MISQVPHPARPDFRALSNPLKINGERLDLRVCSPLGADTADLVPAATSATKRAAEG